MTTAADLARTLKAKRSGAGWIARCPAHEDRRASLSITEGEGGRLLLHCHAGCDFQDILKAASVETTGPNGAERNEQKARRQIVATYDYVDARGDLAFQVCRTADKRFLQRRPDGEGGWIWNRANTPDLPYRLPELLDSFDLVFVVEGEKDVDNLIELGLTATTNAGGAGKCPDGFGRYFDGRHVVIIPDNDDSGRKHARKVARKLGGKAASIKVVELPGLPHKGDVSDWLANGGTRQKLDELVAAATYWGGEGDGGEEPKAGQQPLPPIEAFDVPYFLKMKMKRRRFVIEPWLREKGLAMVHAKTGIGKTWFGLSCAYAIATGTKYLKWSAPEPLHVVYLDGEMAAEDMQSRLGTICTTIPESSYFKVVSFDQYDGPVPNLASEEGQQRLEPVIADADVVFVDNLSCMVFDYGRSDAESWEIIQTWLLSLRRRNKSVVMLHHSGKSGTQRGTSRRGDALDAIINLDRPADATGADGCRFMVTFEKSRGQLGAAGEPFEAMLEDGIWTMKNEDLSQLTVVADLILEQKSIRKIADELGIAPTKVHRLKKQAMERGIL